MFTPTSEYICTETEIHDHEVALYNLLRTKLSLLRLYIAMA